MRRRPWPGQPAGAGALAAAAARPWRLGAPAPQQAGLLHEGSGRVLEAVRYRVDPADRDAFLAAMAEVRLVRLRAGALVWRLYEDVARPESWTELWAVESWAEHLRAAGRLDEADRAALARAAALHRGEGPPEASRHLNVAPP